MEYAMVLAGSLILSGCAMTPVGHDPNQQTIIIHKQTSTQLDSCKMLGPVTTDTYGNIFNFDSLAEETFMGQAKTKYGSAVDNIALINRQALPAGHIILQGIAYNCFKQSTDK